MSAIQEWIINIDEERFRTLWLKIGGNEDHAPSILLEEYPDDKTRERDEKRNQRTLGEYTDDNTIHLFYKNNWLDWYETKETFRQKITDTFSHEVSHARLTRGGLGILSFIHNSTSWFLHIVAQYPLMSVITFFSLFFGPSIYGLTFLFSSPIATVFISIFAGLIGGWIFATYGGILLVQCREAVTDSYAAMLRKKYAEDISNIIRIIDAADAFPKNAIGQFAFGYYSASRDAN